MRSIPSRLNIAFFDVAMPTTSNFRRLCSFSSSYWERICSINFPPTVPTPQIKRFSTLYSDKKNESCMTLSDFLKDEPSTTNDIFVSLAPCAHAITLIPLLPKTPKSFPAIPGVCFIFSPTMAIVARLLSACIGNMAPVSISFANSLFNTSTAICASISRTPMEVEFSEEA